MLYKFRSPATGDVVMLGPNGDELLRLIGREPAAKGIIEPATMAGAVAALRAAVEAAEAPPEDEEGVDAARRVGLRQRVWPMVQMLERARAADVPVVWGV
jgi:hypothetical protein